MPKLVLLRIPGIHNDWRTQRPIPNLGVGFLAQIAKNEGYEATVLEGHMFLDSGYLSPKFNYRQRIDFFIREVEEEDPDVLGISVLSSDLAVGIEFARKYRQLHPKTRIIMGGVGTNGVAEIIARYALDSLDIIVRGEGEESFKEVLREIKKKKPDLTKIKGISYREKGWRHNPPRPLIKNLDSLPMTTLEDYKHLPPNILSLLPVERGCPGNCHFCFATKTWGKGRYFSPERIISQGKHLLKFQKLPNKSLFLSDSNIFADEKKGEEVVNSILKELPEVLGSVNVRVDQITDRLLKLFSKFPNISPLMGIESLSPNLLTFLGKTDNPAKYLEKVNEVIPKIRESGIMYCLSVIYHIPGEKKEDLKKIYDFLMEQNPEKCVLIYCSRLWVEGNTALWDSYEKGELEIYPSYRPPSTELGEQYNDPIFDPLVFLFRNPLIPEGDYNFFADKLREHFEGTPCNYLG